MSQPTTFSIHHSSSAMANELRDYLQAQYHIRDESTVEERKALFKENGNIAQEPYLEATPSYELSDEFSKLAIPTKTKELLTELSKLDVGVFEKPYIHQAEALLNFCAGESLLTATGTGSGKTETFLFSILSSFAEEAARNRQSLNINGARAIVLYPMNALVADQLSRMRKLLGTRVSKDCLKRLCGRHMTFGMYTGRTPFPGIRSDGYHAKAAALLKEYYQPILDDSEMLEKLEKRGKWPSKDIAAFFGAANQRWNTRLTTSTDDAELLMRHEMQAVCPDILITNYSMLEYMLLRPIEQSIFDATAKWLAIEGNFLTFVLDEAHMYRGTTGAEVAYLIRRLLARLNIGPDKVRFILTTASVGNEQDDRDAALKFACRLTGKSSINFIEGTREKMGTSAAASADEGHILATFDTEQFRRNCHTLDATRAQIEDIAKKLNLGDIDASDGIANALYWKFRAFPPARLLVEKLSGHARAVQEVEKKIFPLNNASEQRSALDALLALTNCGKDAVTGRILLPARLHLFLRGVSGIYACVNPECTERKTPQVTGVMGALYTEPRISCACGSRVLELFTHRDCGAAYFRGYTILARQPDFVWNETSNRIGDPNRTSAFAEIDLYPPQSPNPHKARPVWLQLESGKLTWSDPGAGGWALMYVHDTTTNGPSATTPALTFEHCALCKRRVAGGNLDRPRIMDLRTKGEQPFGHVVKQQLICQPCDLSKKKNEFPNQGRKVLVFSDGRQKAAKLAQSIPDEVGADCFRELLVLGVKLLEGINRPLDKVKLSQWYIVFVAACAETYLSFFDGKDAGTLRDSIKEFRRSYNSDLEEALEDNAFSNVPDGFKRQLYKQASGALYSLKFLSVGWLSPRKQAFKRLDDAMSAKSSQWSALPLHSKMALVITWIARLAGDFAIDESLPNYVRKLAVGGTRNSWTHNGKCGEKLKGILTALGIPEKDFEAECRDVFVKIEQGDSGWLKPDSLSLHIDLDHEWWTCGECTAASPYAVEGRCPECGSTLGKLVDPNIDPYTISRKGFWRERLRDVYQRKADPITIEAEEHTAQLGQKDAIGAQPLTERYELRFQDVSRDLQNEPAIDMLSCTTTMEVGVDIGSLTAVALRNVPPQRENYQQRAGRAGRRGSSVSTVTTYCQGNAHDNHYFRNVAEIAAGKPRLLHVKVDNAKIARRHLFAYLVQDFFRHRVAATGSSISASLGTVEDFYGTTLLSIDEFLKSIAPYSTLTSDAVRKCVAWIGGELEGVNSTAQWVVDQAAEFGSLLQNLRTKAEELIQREQNLNANEKTEFLDFLFEHSLLPSYAFPRDLATFNVEKWEDGSVKSAYAPQHSITRALSEYAPGRLIVIDKKTYRSRAVTANVPPTEVDRAAPLFNDVHQRPYVFCSEPTCNYVEDAGFQGNAQLRDGVTCPLCQTGSLSVQDLITPEAFLPFKGYPVDELDDEQDYSYATPAQFPVPVITGNDPGKPGKSIGTNLSSDWWTDRELVVVNKGDSQDRSGFLVCDKCGLAQLGNTSTPSSHERPYFSRSFRKGDRCPGQFQSVFLGARFKTDLVILQAKLSDGIGLAADPSAPDYNALNDALHTLAEALPLAAAHRYDLDPTEFSSGYRVRSIGADLVAELYMFDTLAGGAGYARCAGEEIESILRADVMKIFDCEDARGEGCQRSCYKCLRHYQNQIRHNLLDRTLGKELLRWMLDGTIPPNRTITEQASDLSGLRQMLEFDGVTVDGPVTENGITAPLKAEFDGTVAYIGTYNGLIAQTEADCVVDAASSGIAMPINDYLLTRNLPLCFEEVRRCLGKNSV